MSFQKQNAVVLSVEEVAETEGFVIVVFTEVVSGKIVRSVEKGIKDASGDITEFVRI